MTHTIPTGEYQNKKTGKIVIVSMVSAWVSPKTGLRRVYYNGTRNGVKFGASQALWEDRFEELYMMHFEPTGETLDEVIARDKAGR